MCDHGRLKYVGHRGKTRVFCADCGQELDKSFLEDKKGGKNPSDNAGADKAPAKKTRAKKAV